MSGPPKRAPFVNFRIGPPRCGRSARSACTTSVMLKRLSRRAIKQFKGPLNEAGRLMARRVRQMTIEQSMLVSISFWLTVFLPAVGAPMAATWQKPDWAAIVLLNFPDR